MRMSEAVTICFRKFAVFEGRASRSEFWYFFLFTNLLGVLVSSLFKGEEVLLGVIAITSLPFIAVSVRRLHDVGLSGWWFWLPTVGSVIGGQMGIGDGPVPDPRGGYLILAAIGVWVVQMMLPSARVANRFGLPADGASVGPADAVGRLADGVDWVVSQALFFVRIVVVAFIPAMLVMWLGIRGYETWKSRQSPPAASQVRSWSIRFGELSSSFETPGQFTTEAQCDSALTKLREERLSRFGIAIGGASPPPIALGEGARNELMVWSAAKCTQRSH